MASEGSHESKVLINNCLLSGLQNVAFTQNVSEQAISLLGNDFVNTQLTTPTTTTASVDKFLTNSDFVTGLSGSSNISGQFIYGDNIIDYNSGVLNGYTVTARVATLPQIAFDFTIYGDMSGSNTSTLANASGDNALQTIPTSGIVITYDKDATNPVQSFVFTENYNWEPIYGMNSNKPNQIVFKGPIVQSATVNIEVENYEPEHNYSFLETSKDRSRNIKLEIYGETGNILNQFSLSNAHLVSETITQGMNNTVVASLVYNGLKKSDIVQPNGLLNVQSFASIKLLGSPTFTTVPNGGVVEYASTNETLWRNPATVTERYVSDGFEDDDNSVHMNVSFSKMVVDNILTPATIPSFPVRRNGNTSYSRS